jgi:hypothetical protein
MSMEVAKITTYGKINQLLALAGPSNRDTARPDTVYGE